jgi:hypothetical protein
VAITSQLDSKLVALLEDSILIAIDYSNRNEVVFDIISKESDDWCRYYLYIRESSNFYYQRYETSFQRTGFNNLRRLNFDDKRSEWIKELNTWDNPFTKENGIEIRLYDGEILRFVGSQLSLDQSFVEGPIDSIAQYSDGKPDHIEQSKATVVTNESFSKPSETIIETVSTDVLEFEPTEGMSEIEVESEEISESTEQMEDKPEYIDPEFDEALTKIDSLKDHVELEEKDIQVIDQQETIPIDEPLSLNDIPLEDERVTEAEFKEIEPSLNEEETFDEISEEPDLSSTDHEIELEAAIHNEIQPSEIESEPENTDIPLLKQITEYAIPQQSKAVDSETKSINIVAGVTEENRLQIENLGYDTVNKLSKAKIVKLTEIKGIGKATARKIIQSASEIMENNST